MSDILKQHKLWLEGGKEGARADLRCADLRCADLRGANLEDADLEDADLQGAVFPAGYGKLPGVAEPEPEVARKFDKGKPAYQFIDERVFGGEPPPSATCPLLEWRYEGDSLVGGPRMLQSVFAITAQLYGTRDPESTARKELARVLAYGDQKYGCVQYRRGLKWSQLWRAAVGHIEEHMSGNLYDDESGLMHLSHALGAIMMLYVHQVDGLGTDDRGEVWPR